VNADEIRAARRQLGLSLSEFGEAIGIDGSCKTRAARVRDMESGRRDITGPVSRVVEALLAGWRPGKTDTEWFLIAKDILS
jgi:transcriptional regulator with XRE-family HTH domain